MKQLGNIAACWALAAVAWRASAATSPLTPEQERATFQLADTNLVIELVAAEPDVRAPVAIAWDADGRMFVAEMTDYPSGPVNGRIRLLEDRDNDGRYEHATIFATNVAYPNGVMAWKNGVLVTAAPDIWFLADTNGDGVSDVREKILRGFTEGNQQLRVNGLFWGIDNWIYGANGRSDGEVKWADGTKAGSIRRHDFRFRPETRQFEVIAGNSQFGMGQDDWGNRFPVFNNTPIRHVVMEDRYLERQPLLAGTDVVPSISPASDGNRVFALTPPTLLIPQPVGFFTSACGPSVYRGTALPTAYRGNYFVCEPVQNVVQRRVLKPSGSTFVAEYADGALVFDPARFPNAGSETGAPKEFLASTDRWFHGVFTASGPDGAFYIVDFYRDLVEHPHWVAPEIRDKVDWRKGEEHGRIWRVRAKDAKPLKVEKLSRASNAELVRTIESNNGWTRDTAQRLLIGRGTRDVVPLLEKLASQAAAAETRVAALHLLERLSAKPGEAFVTSLRDPNPAVRRHAVRLFAQAMGVAIKQANGVNAVKVLSKLANDPDPQVRLQLACSLGVFSDDEGQVEALARLAQHPELDRWEALAVVGSAGARSWTLMLRCQSVLEHATENQLGLLQQLSAVVAGGTNATERAALFAWLQRIPSPNRLVLSASALEVLPIKERLEFSRQPELQTVMNVALDPAASAPVRIGAIRTMVFRQDATDTLKPVAALLSASQPEEIQQAAARALLDANNAPMPKLAFARWASVSRSTQRQMIASSPRNSRSAMALLDAVTGDKVPLAHVDPTTRQALLKSKSTVVAERAARLFALTASADREVALAKYRGSLKLAGERARGAMLYERVCLVCHQMQGVGAKVGPDLSGIGQHARETLLVDILDPSRQVLPDFVAYSATTKSGDSYTGFIANESATTVTLRRPNEPDVTLPRAELTEFKTGGKSLMPDGLEAGLSEQEVADLIEFLRRPDRTLFTHSQ
jgi:putative membrane-bound dehydrogenase-like protein